MTWPSAPPGYEWVKVTDLGISQRIFDGPDCYQWRKVFAWWPVKTIGGQYVWFDQVFKRKFWAVYGTGFHMEPCVEYATLFELIRDYE